MKIVKLKNSIGNSIMKQGIIIIFIIFIIAVSFASKAFLTAENILLVLRQVSIIGVMAVGITYVVIGGNYDLSVGSLLSLTTVIAVDMHDKVGPLLAILIALMVGILVGCINGSLVGFLKLNSMIVTLGMLTLLQGVTYIYTGGQNVIIKYPDKTWFAFFGRGFLWSVPVPAIIFGLFAIIFGCVLAKTVYGRKLYAVGGNKIASTFTGIRGDLVTFSTFIFSALATSIGGIIMASRVMGSQNTVGQGYELNVLAAVILGGTSLLGGSGSIFKTVIGVLILGFMQNALIMLGYPYYSQWLVTWFVIVAVVWLDLASRRGKFFA